MANRRMKKWVSLALSILIVLTSVPVNRVHADGVPKAESDTSITVGTNADDQSAGFEQTSEDEIPDASETPA
ncbi:MAG: hypothetical protein J6Z38_08405, partial [Lachnospiraceae bacterium]|nr:hypothetical protein [Lachnospiraceae bacterium]